MKAAEEIRSDKVLVGYILMLICGPVLGGFGSIYWFFTNWKIGILWFLGCMFICVLIDWHFFYMAEYDDVPVQCCPTKKLRRVIIVR